MTHPPDPFEVLGLAPTVDLAAIKRAYFAKLAKSPPHADPQGFRVLRAAYEALGTESSRRLAVVRAPLDPAAERARFEAEWGPRLAQLEAADNASRSVAVFVARLSRMTWEEARAVK